MKREMALIKIFRILEKSIPGTLFDFALLRWMRLSCRATAVF